MGLGVDGDAAVGAAYLNSIAKFDEISTGAGWANHAVNSYVFFDSIPMASVPQLVVVQRRTDVDLVARRVARKDSVLYRVLGMPPIVRWFESELGSR
jgi:hypothetical protein